LHPTHCVLTNVEYIRRTTQQGFVARVLEREYILHRRQGCRISHWLISSGSETSETASPAEIEGLLRSGKARLKDAGAGHYDTTGVLGSSSAERADLEQYLRSL
jgi:hypothetical protein